MRTALKKDKDGVVFKLQPFADIHLGNSISDTYPAAGNIKYVYMLHIISLLILLIAWFNYINLSTANSFKRAAEIGVRKSGLARAKKKPCYPVYQRVVTGKPAILICGSSLGFFIATFV